MEMEEDMEIEPMALEVSEVDLEYEFDAARWYDFSREESPAEARVAELWFETAQTYPPSPFVTKLLLREDLSDDKTELSTESQDGEATADICDTDGEVRQLPDYFATGNGIRSGVFTTFQAGNLKKVPNQPLYKGTTFNNHIHTDKQKCRPKLSIKPIARSSTLMKPTASQLAKQNHSRLHMQVDQINEKGLYGSSGSEIQAAKRQKLEEGLLRKVGDMKQEINFVHKTSKKITSCGRVWQDATLDRNMQHTRTKITIPQEPDLATAHRAGRIRPKKDVKTEQTSTAVYRFKARPFNRKIFEAPSLPIRKKSTPKLPEFQEFHLKTSERAMQHSSAVTTTSYRCNDSDKGSENPNTTFVLDGFNRETRRPNAMDISKHDVSNGNYVFKAFRHNKNVLSSRGDIGGLRNNKKETTIPLETNYHMEKRLQQDLPADLFSKLSITSELQPNNGSRSRFRQPTSGLAKGSKENRPNVHEITSKAMGTPISSAGLQTQCDNSDIIPRIRQQWTDRRYSKRDHKVSEESIADPLIIESLGSFLV
ncbi:PREDICTED: protein TPX2-like isoform X2 [Tarenaya hassleriana]|uniref:protein TPX2-like isoform X2 n=1 Tax=Tarenaya hassleriana TaxID=28532 RepID=UPI00053CA5E9|nr:PREDICTED: protein TPX2-like isoform X2 [Tarenaya hassleriana]